MHVDRVLDHLRASDALLEGHFELSSKKHSDKYFQCALVLQDAARAEELARALAEALPAAGVDPASVDAVVGPALGAVVWAHEVGRALGRRAIFTERADGAMCLRRGFTLEPGERVLVVEDVLTTGGSAREVIELCRAADARVLGVGAIVNRSGTNPFADLDVPLAALADVEAVAWEPDACPACASGAPAAVKPGSRA